MMKVRGVSGRRVGLLGAGAEFVALAEAIEAAGGEPVILRDDLAVLTGETTTALRADARPDLDRIIVSPEIALGPEVPDPLVRLALEHGIPLDTPLGLFFASFGAEDWARFDTVPRVVVLLKEDGGAQTARALEAVLDADGAPCQIIGTARALFEIEPVQDREVVLLVCSYQDVALARALTPDAVLLQNGVPGRLVAEGGPDRAVISVDAPMGAFLVNQTREAPTDDRVIATSLTRKLPGAGWNMFWRKGFLTETRKERQVAGMDMRPELEVLGESGPATLMGSYALARALGVAPRAAEASLRQFVSDARE